MQRWLSQGRSPRAARGAQRDACGVLAAACRWRAGLSHLLSPRKLHVCERARMCSSVHHSLSRAQTKESSEYKSDTYQHISEKAYPC